MYCKISKIEYYTGPPENTMLITGQFMVSLSVRWVHQNRINELKKLQSVRGIGNKIKIKICDLEYCGVFVFYKNKSEQLIENIYKLRRVKLTKLNCLQLKVS